MNTNAIVLPSGDLASRGLAIPFRQQIEKLISTNSIVELDLSKVQSISESYADELFGILVKEFGLEIILDRMKIINADDYVLDSIASVIERRSKIYS